MFLTSIIANLGIRTTCFSIPLFVISFRDKKNEHSAHHTHCSLNLRCFVLESARQDHKILLTPVLSLFRSDKLSFRAH